MKRHWLGNPAVYTVTSPILTILGAGTSIIAPILLNPAGFVKFALIVSIFQYIAEFDLGLNRLSDRYLTRGRRDWTGFVNTILLARLWVAGCIVGVGIIVLLFTLDSLIFLTIVAGVAAMLTTGPIAIYRARSQIAIFTLAAVAGQFGMSLPRLAGLLIDGVQGCVIAFTVWYSATAAILYRGFIGQLKPIQTRSLRSTFSQSIPMFALSSSWLLYLLASRWFSWLLTSDHEAGLFAFGANLALIGINTIGTVSQTYYPRHLSFSNSAALATELLRLLAVVSLGCLLAIVLCRFGMPIAFPSYTAATASTAAVILSGIPLCLTAWTIPLVIARSRRPMLHSLTCFGPSLISMFVLMWSGTQFGIIGQSLAAIPPALLVLGIVLHFVVRDGMLQSGAAKSVLAAATLSLSGCVVVWYLVF